jgi:hypothetical protein
MLPLLNIPIGATVTAECPNCGEKKFSVTNRDGSGYLYNCFRASCGCRGYIPLGGKSLFATDAPIAPREESRPYSGPLYAPNPEDLVLLNAVYGFTPEHVSRSGVRFTIDGNAAYPIYANDRTVKGTHLRYRKFSPGRAKAYTHMNSQTVTKSSWYTSPAGCPSLMIVEDIPSAVRASHYMDTMALLGTSLDPRDIPLIAAKYTEVFVALDPDADEAALRVRNWLAGWVDWLYVMKLPRDIKDMREEELGDYMASFEV